MSDQPDPRVESSRWVLPAAGAPLQFTWNYGRGREPLLGLYQRGKDKQWDSVTRIDWDMSVDVDDPLAMPDSALPLFGTRYWAQMSATQHSQVRHEYAAWQFSQFTHGEQGALICAARIVECVPDLDAKFYAATQVMDEARHLEIFTKFVREKIGSTYVINDGLQRLFADTLDDGRWDMLHLGIQVLIEGLALASFGMLRDLSRSPLPRQILAYVMQDEARHIAFGRLALKDHYRAMRPAELREREDFVIEGCRLLRERTLGFEVWRRFGIEEAAARVAIAESGQANLFLPMLFNRLVPCLDGIGLWTERVRSELGAMGVLGSTYVPMEKLNAVDDKIAARIDRERGAAEERARHSEVDQVIATEEQE